MWQNRVFLCDNLTLALVLTMTLTLNLTLNLTLTECLTFDILSMSFDIHAERRGGFAEGLFMKTAVFIVLSRGVAILIQPNGTYANSTKN